MTESEAAMLNHSSPAENASPSSLSLQKSEELFRSVLETSPDGFTILRSVRDAAGTIVDFVIEYINPVAAHDLSLTPAELQGQTLLHLVPECKTSGLFERYVTVVESGAMTTFETAVNPPSGSHWMRNTVVKLNDGVVVSRVAIEVTERIPAETTLRQQETELRLITNALPVLISFVDNELRYRFTNQRYQEWFGQQTADVEGKYIWEVLGEATYNFIRPYVEQVLAGQQITFENKVPYQGADIRDVVVTYVPRFNSEGIVEGFVSLVTDISDRKRDEETLRQSEERLRIAQQAANAGVWDWDITTNQVTWSDEYYRLYGLDPASMLPSYDNWLSSIVEQDRDRVDRASRNALKHQIDLNVEFRILHPVHGERWLTAIGQTFYNDRRRPIRMTGIALDITDRKRAEAALRQSEQRYRYLAESIPQLVWTADASGVLLDVNQRWSTFTGLTLPQAQIEGWSAIVHPDDVATLSHNWAIAQQEGTYYQAEGRMRRIDGVYRWHLHQAVPLKDEQGRLIKWFGTATDIEDQKQLEQQRIDLLKQEQAAREQAEIANRIKDEFLAVLSHELRSPLNPILGWTKLLQSRTLDEHKTKHALETIERNTRLQTQLIEDLLDVSRILQGKLALSTTIVDLNSTIEAALETVKLAAEAKGIHLIKNLNSTAEQVMGDATRLQQVIWNLLSNAVKFTPSGGTVEIRLEQVNTYAQIQVKDTGKGINPQFLPYIFEYFRQEDSTTTRKFGGLGLGLAIVRHLTELHGGTLWAESPGEGLGATFTVRLPLLIRPELRDLRSEDAAFRIPDSASNMPLDGASILVVDDEADVRDIVSFILEQAGASVSTAASASHALKQLEQSLPDLLLCDIGMPDMDGYTLIRQLRSRPPAQGGQILAIALSAYAAEADQQQALAVGFQRYLAKPVEPAHLVAEVASLLQSATPKNP